MAKSWENMIFSKKNPDFLDIFLPNLGLKPIFLFLTIFGTFLLLFFSQKKINPEILWGKK